MIYLVSRRLSLKGLYLAKDRNPFYVLGIISFLFFVIFFISSFVVLLIITFLIVLCICLLLLKLWSRIYKVEDCAEQRFNVTTKDDWNLRVHLHKAQTKAANKYPVVLCHGLAANKYSVDLDADHSVACYLKEKGYTVFAVNLRGVGGSFHTSGQKKYGLFF